MLKSKGTNKTTVMVLCRVSNLGTVPVVSTIAFIEFVIG